MPSKRKAKSIATAFGAELRKARGAAGLTQQTLAERAEVDPVFISFLENGHRQPSLTVLLALERQLGLAAGDLSRRTAAAIDRHLGKEKPRGTRSIK